MISDSDYEELRARLTADLNSQFAPNTISSEVDRLSGWKRKMVADGSLGRVFNGAQWLDGVAIRDGVISGAKLKATLVISNTFTTADTDVTPTADRVTITSAGIKAYGTVSGVPNTQTLSIGNNGDFTFGDVGHNPITYVASTHTLTVPAAVIGSLTIANVGGGVLGGTYKTASGTGARLEFDTAGIRAYNSSNTKTFDVVASSGALDLTGTLTVGSGGKIKFGSGGADYLDNNTLHFEVGTGETAVTEFKNGANTPYGSYAGLASSSGATVKSYAYYTATRFAGLYLSGLSASGGFTLLGDYDASHEAAITGTGSSTSAELSLAATSSSGSTWIDMVADNTAANGYMNLYAGNVQVANLVSTNRALSLYGYLYPGTGSGIGSSYIYNDGSNIRVSGNLALGGALYPSAQTTRYIVDNGSQISIGGGALTAPSGLYAPIFTGCTLVNTGTLNNFSAVLGTNGKLVISLNGTTYAIPFFNNA